MSDDRTRPNALGPRWGMILSLCLCAGLLPGVGGQVHSAEAKRSDQLYQDYCSVCHGEGGDGRSHAVRGMVPPPRDFTAPASRTGLTRERMIASVRDGVPGTAMVGWSSQLSDAQIEGIVDYVREELMAIRPLSAGSLDGKAIYAFSCSVCHGEDGTGAMWGVESMDPPPVSFSRLDPERSMPRARMIVSVTHGRPGTSMMAFNSQLSAEQIEAVVDYVRNTFMTGMTGQEIGEAPEQLATPAHPESTVGLAVLHGDDLVPRATRPDPNPEDVDPDAPMPFDLTGDPARGGVLFAESCVACHGANGDGRGPRAYFIYPRPLSFIATENRARLNRKDLFNSIKKGVRGREMPAWGKVFEDQQIADVAEYVYQVFVAPEAPAWER